MKAPTTPIKQTECTIGNLPGTPIKLPRSAHQLVSFDQTPCVKRKYVRVEKRRKSGVPNKGPAYEKHVRKYIEEHVHKLTVTDDVAGFGSGHDVTCSYQNEPVPFEVKGTGAEFMQSSLCYVLSESKWKCSTSNKIPTSSRYMFENAINGSVIFNGRIPSFCISKITHSQWLTEKHLFKDTYVDIEDPQFISKLYENKGTRYIQIKNKGLFSTGEDVCDFGVDKLVCKSRLRIRSKIHKTSSASGQCVLSVTVSCKPQGKIPKSSVSFD